MSSCVTIDSNGCIILVGGCVATTPGGQNTDSCLAGCCQITFANQIFLPAGFTIVGNNFTTSSPSLDFQITIASCPSDPPNITINPGNQWEWQLPYLGSVPGCSDHTLTSTANLPCPPMDSDNATQSVWSINGTDSRIMSVNCCQIISTPTTTHFTATNIIGTYQIGTFAETSPTDPIWAGDFDSYAGGDSWQPFQQLNGTTGHVSIPLLSGKFANHATLVLNVGGANPGDTSHCYQLGITLTGSTATGGSYGAVWGRMGGGPGAVGITESRDLTVGPLYIFVA